MHTEDVLNAPSLVCVMKAVGNTIMVGGLFHSRRMPLLCSRTHVCSHPPTHPPHAHPQLCPNRAAALAGEKVEKKFVLYQTLYKFTSEDPDDLQFESNQILRYGSARRVWGQ